MRLQHCHAAAAAATAIITVIVILYKLLLCAIPPTSRRCTRSRKNASQVRMTLRLLILSFFLPNNARDQQAETLGEEGERPPER